MRIAVNGYVGSHLTGIGRYLDELVLRWRARCEQEGHTVVLFANPDSPLASAREPWVERREIPAPTTSSVKNLLWAVKDAARAYRAGEADVVFQPNFTWTPSLRVPVVSTIHDLIEFRVKGKFDPHRVLYRQRAVPRMARKSAHVLTVSETSKRDIVELFGTAPSKVTVVLNGVAPRFAPSERARAPELAAATGVSGPYVLFVGTLDHPGKNPATLLRAFAARRAQLPAGTRVVLAGKPGKGYEELVAIAESVGLGPGSAHAVWTGYVPDQLLPALYACAGAFVFPSLYEGFGLPVAEALASGVPTITSNIGALAEVGGDAALLVDDPRDAGQLGEALLRAFRPDEAERRAALGVARARRFDWDLAADTTLDVILRHARR